MLSLIFKIQGFFRKVLRRGDGDGSPQVSQEGGEGISAKIPIKKNISNEVVSHRENREKSSESSNRSRDRPSESRRSRDRPRFRDNPGRNPTQSSGFRRNERGGQNDRNTQNDDLHPDRKFGGSQNLAQDPDFYKNSDSMHPISDDSINRITRNLYDDKGKGHDHDRAHFLSEESDHPKNGAFSQFNSVTFEENFENFSLEDTLLKTLKDLNILAPTRVQSVAIPRVLNGENLICISQTGSGKTLAFLLPLLQKMIRKEVQQSLVLSPTRELAIQISSVLSKFGTQLGFSHALVIGGMDMREQKSVLRKYPEVLVATPGRLLDMVRSGLIWLKYTNFVVLDEADRMLDMGFEKDLVDILRELPPVRQVLLFTATMLPGVEKIATNHVKNFAKIQIDNPSAVADSISHYMIPVSGDKASKFELLKEVLELHSGKIVVFFNTIRETKSNHEFFRRMDNSLVTCIHSDKSQDAREKSIHDFRTGRRRFLFATDVAARGIDVPDVELVINYDVPNNPEDYIHRIGRTGRGGNTGIAKMFYTARDRRLVLAIEKILKRSIQEDSHPYVNASKQELFSRDAPPSSHNRNKRYNKGYSQRRR